MGRMTAFRRAGLVAAAGLMLAGLAACSDYEGALPKHMRPLDSGTRALIERKGMDQRSPILIRIFKEESTLEVWKLQRATGRYAFLKDYEVCAWSGVLGPKIAEGDRQAPEGFYTIRPAQMNPNSNYYLAFNMGYPNTFDRSLGRTGSELMVHGACSSRGCYSMTDEHIQEIYTLGRLAFQGGQREFQVHAFPFRMTPANLARHRNDPNMPFWLMLKEGYDHFDIVGEPPKVDVCENRYIFNSVPGDGHNFNPSGICPPMEMPERIRVAVAEKQARDNARMLQIAERLDRRENATGAEALVLALATPSSAERAAPMSIATTTLPEVTASTPLTATLAAPPAPAPIPLTPEPATVAATEPAAAPTPTPRPETPTTVAAADPAPAAESGFLPVPELRTGEIETPTPQEPPVVVQETAPAVETATLEERMLVESEPLDPSVASAYAEAQAQEDGLSGLLLRLIQGQNEQ